MKISGYQYKDAGLNPSHGYLLPSILRTLETETANGLTKRVFELGCGNGVIANELYKRGYDVAGIDPSEQGVRVANKTYPHLQICGGSTEDDLAVRFGKFPIVLSLEVVEHV